MGPLFFLPQESRWTRFLWRRTRLWFFSRSEDKRKYPPLGFLIFVGIPLGWSLDSPRADTAAEWILSLPTPCSMAPHIVGILYKATPRHSMCWISSLPCVYLCNSCLFWAVSDPDRQAIIGTVRSHLSTTLQRLAQTSPKRHINESFPRLKGRLTVSAFCPIEPQRRPIIWMSETFFSYIIINGR